MNTNTLWMDTINREMENLKVSFDVFDDGSKIPVGYKKESCHLVFDAHMMLERKSRWAKDGKRPLSLNGPPLLELYLERSFELH